MSTAARRPTHRALLAAGLLLALPAAVLAQNPPDLAGTWELTSQLSLPLEGNGGACDFAGSAVISQDGGEFSGTADLALRSGPQGCPAQMSADVSGVVDPDGTIDAAMLMGGNLGTATFSGIASSSSNRGGGAGTAGGTATVDSGPFAGSGGPWSAILGGGPSVLEIPTLTAFGLLFLVALLASSALLIVRRRPAV